MDRENSRFMPRLYGIYLVLTQKFPSSHTIARLGKPSESIANFYTEIQILLYLSCSEKEIDHQRSQWLSVQIESVCVLHILLQRHIHLPRELNSLLLEPILQQLFGSFVLALCQTSVELKR
ncbi:hypothetical protein NPIL_89621 [Nephila pilipes]|uniref:Uncharacterized protein n=1 Tax=Nephila pilipes TaxID=299642 RepID=A0A8X6N169_NEPPI|nr:hypothetical protein NPIL_89621 [Nephila pilipes]